MFESTNTLQHCLLQDTLVAGNIFTRKWHAIRLGNFYFFAQESEKREQPVVISQKKTWKESPSKSFDKTYSVSLNLKIARLNSNYLTSKLHTSPTNFAQVKKENRIACCDFTEKRRKGKPDVHIL